ncbi:translocation/assembly module TamB domain-containing protein [Paracoccus luteus]|uniref:translocation/assembly module TamB domain-containing protein n=1 Tax=Paracoccus luteus TaxID=2508543 RepID=UPI00106F6CE1|nr:translocation/assembly module TamB domain-containing protein [Paracoccus luteus]
MARLFRLLAPVLVLLTALMLALPPATARAQDTPAVPAQGLAADAADLSAEVDDDRGFITRFLENNLSSAGRKVVITGFQGALSSRATFEQLTIADADGVWITLRNGAIQWNRSALFARRIEIQELSAAEILLPRLPRSEKTGPRAEVRDFALPTLPVGIDIARISAGRVDLGQPVLGEAAVVSIDGRMNLAGGEGAAQLAINRVDGKRGVFALDAAYSNATTNLKLDLTLDEAEGGLFANAIDLYGRPSVHAEIRGEGPVADFAADIRLATDGQDRVTGRASARSQAGDDGTPGTGFRLELSGDVASLLPPDNRDFFGASSQLLAEGWRGQDGRLSLPVLLVDTEALNLTGSVTTSGAGAPQSVVVLLTLGQDAGATRLPVRLPFGGTATDVRSGSLQISYDAAQGDGWTLKGRLGDLAQNGTSLGALTLDGSGTVRLQDGDLREVLGRIGFAVERLALADAGLTQALGDRIEGSTGFDLTPGNAVEFDDFVLRGADYGLEGVIRADGLGSGITLSGDLAARYDDLSRLSTLAGRPLSGRAEGTVAGLYTVLTRGFDAEVALTGTDITVDQPQADRLLAGRSTITASARRDDEGIEIRDLTVNAQRLTAEARGVINSDTTDLRANLRLSSLTDADPAMAGSLVAEAAVTGTPGSRRVTLSGEATDLVVGVAQLDGLLRGRTNLTAIAQEQDGAFVIDTLRVANPQITADGTGRFGADALDARLNLAIPDLGVLRQGLSGAITAQATAREADGVRFIEMTGTGEELRLGQQDVDGALTGTTRFALSAEEKGGIVTIRDLDLSNQQMTATVEGVLGQGVTDLTATADVRSLAAFGRGWRGALTLDGSVTDQNGQRVFDLSGRGTDLSLGQAQVDGALTGVTDIRLRGTQAGQRITLDTLRLVNEQAEILATGVIGPDDTDLRAQAELRNLAALGLGWGGSLRASGSLVDDGSGARRLVVDGVARDLSLGQAQADAALAGETRLTVRGSQRGGVFTIEDATVDNARLNAVARGTIGNGRTDVAAELRAASIGFLGAGFGGAIEAAATVVDDGAGTRLTAQGTASGLRVGNPAADALLAGQTRFDLAARRTHAGAITVERLDAANGQLRVNAEGDPARGLRVDAALSDLALLAPGFPGPATVTGTVRQGATEYGVDLSATAPGGTRAQIAGTAARDFSTADLRVSGVSDAALVNPLLRVRSVEGPVDFDLRLNGRPALENVTGRVRLPNARLSDPKLGLRIETLSATADLNGGLIQIDARGAIAAGGRLAVTGPVDLRGGSPRLDLRVSLDGVVLRDPTLYETVAYGDLTVSGALAEGPLIAGTIRLGETEIRIPSTGLGGARAIPDITHLNDAPAVRATRAKAGLLPFPSADSRIAGMQAPPATPPAVQAQLDLTILAPNQIFVRGRGVDAELGGDLRLTGRANNVVPVGQFELIRGRVDLLGKRFDMTEGLIELQGSLVPVLRLVAQTEQDGIVTRIIIDGEIRDPEITFESVPDMPEEEVLSQLLFGRGLDTISPLQAAQLANALAVLAGRGGEGIVAGIRNSVGLDDLDLATDDQGNVSVRAGKYLSRNLYTDLSVDADGKSTINLNLDINDAVTARGAIGSEGDSTIGVFYERDY